LLALEINSAGLGFLSFRTVEFLEEVKKIWILGGKKWD
jgi:hypothetical protein